MKMKVTQSCPTLCDPMDCPWNSLGQNTRESGLSLLQGIFPTQGSNPGLLHCRWFSWIIYQLSHQESPIEVAQSCPTLQSHGLYSPWNSPDQNIGVGSLSLLQGIFPTQGLNPGLQLCRQILYQLSYKGSPRILEWVVYPFSRGSSWPRNWTQVSCTAGRFFTIWTIIMTQHLGISDTGYLLYLDNILFLNLLDDRL